MQCYFDVFHMHHLTTARNCKENRSQTKLFPNLVKKKEKKEENKKENKNKQKEEKKDKRNT